MRFIHLIVANLKRKKLRTVLTFLSILVAFLLYGYLSAIRVALAQGVDVAGADRLVVRHKVSIIQLLPENYERQIESIDGIAEAVHQTWFGGIYQKPSNFFAQMPVQPEEFLSVYPEYRLSEEDRARWLSTRTGAIAGRSLAERFGWEIGDRIPIQATIWQLENGGSSWEFDLVGIYDGAEAQTDTTQFFFRYDFFDEARITARGQVGWYTVKISDPEQAATVAESIDNRFANSPAETKTETEGAFVQAFAKQIGNIAAIMMAIMGAVFFTILLVAGNTMAQAVRERIGEIGVLKAIGFTHRQVLAMVLAEAMLLVGAGGFAGLAIAWLTISLGDPTGVLPMFVFKIQDLMLGATMVLILGVIVGIVPALHAMRIQTADALRRL